MHDMILIGVAVVVFLCVVGPMIWGLYRVSRQERKPLSGVGAEKAAKDLHQMRERVVAASATMAKRAEEQKEKKKPPGFPLSIIQAAFSFCLLVLVDYPSKIRIVRK